MIPGTRERMPAPAGDGIPFLVRGRTREAALYADGCQTIVGNVTHPSCPDGSARSYSRMNRAGMPGLSASHRKYRVPATSPPRPGCAPAPQADRFRTRAVTCTGRKATRPGHTRNCSTQRPTSAGSGRCLPGEAVYFCRRIIPQTIIATRPWNRFWRYERPELPVSGFGTAWSERGGGAGVADTANRPCGAGAWGEECVGHDFR